MRIKKTGLIVGTGLAILGLMCAGAVKAIQVNENQQLTFKSITEQCRNNIDTDGFGHAKVKAGHIENESSSINIPCILELHEGSTLQFTKVNLETANLFITTQQNAKQAAHIVIKDSKFKSSGGGFYIQLPVTESSVDISNSQFNYPLSAGASVGSGEDDKRAFLRVIGSSFISKSKDSEGVLLVSTGHAEFKDNQFKIGNPDEDALLVAAKCQESNNGQAIVHCQ